MFVRGGVCFIRTVRWVAASSSSIGCILLMVADVVVVVNVSAVIIQMLLLHFSCRIVGDRSVHLDDLLTRFLFLTFIAVMACSYLNYYNCRRTRRILLLLLLIFFYLYISLSLLLFNEMKSVRLKLMIIKSTGGRY